ncbi:hypothetical protein A9404_06455 [Halothiobacillus diazotrophicus]|uniref:DUF917 domain-containing protein n=1 Tax=Halothiobacillus diazotrophicus TaxID=1860122 RepID=A0A191ZGR0_9GAMM|nr:DUF917 family protein [Halothiobacillus diazotrophicus]ANJ67071.1 hypothetical protein A9404_06455 [Halothiobacillus diazotrophicus]
MAGLEYGLNDFRQIAAGAAVLGSGGGGSYADAVRVLNELEQRGWSGSVVVQPYDGATNACVLALMGSPDAADTLTLADMERAIAHTVCTFEVATGMALGTVVPVEVGPVNSLIPLIAATLSTNSIAWVVDGDGAGRAVPELPQTTYSGCRALAATPCALADDARSPEAAQSAVLRAPTAAQVESLAGGIVATAAFGSFSGIALWPSNATNGYALSEGYLFGTLSQAHALGEYLLAGSVPRRTVDVANRIAELTERVATPVATNFYITEVSESTNASSLDAGIIRLDNTPDPINSAATVYLYNLNENLIMYSSEQTDPCVIAPDSICYYSESTGRGFSNATDDLATYFDFRTGRSTGLAVSVIKVAAVPAFTYAPGVLASFATLLRKIGFAGALPYSG